MFEILSKLNVVAIGIITAIVFILVTAVIMSLVVRRKYKKVGRALTKVRGQGEKASDNTILDIIMEEFRLSAGTSPDEVNTQAIIEKIFNRELRGSAFSERFLKHSISLMIILGLLGTFYGLTLSISDLVRALSTSTNVEVLNGVDSIVSTLIDSVKGMSVAFVTSLFGIASSIILTILNIILNVEGTKVSVMVEIEEYLDNKVAAEIRKNNKTEYNMLTEALKGTFEEFGHRIDESLRKSMNYQTSNLTTATKKIEDSSLAFLRTIQTFDQCIQRFSEDTRDLSEFNYQLRTNIERMNVSFADLVDDLKHYSKGMDMKRRGYDEVATGLDNPRRRND